MTGIILYSLAFVLLLLSWIKSRKKTKMALKKAWKQFVKLVPSMSAIMLFMGISLSVMDITLISRVIGTNSGLPGILVSMVLGSVIFMPGFIAFPLASGLLDYGAGYPQMSGFVATLMGVGITTLPMEIQFFGKKASIYRNILCFIAASALVAVVWRIGLK